MAVSFDKTRDLGLLAELTQETPPDQVCDIVNRVFQDLVKDPNCLIATQSPNESVDEFVEKIIVPLVSSGAATPHRLFFEILKEVASHNSSFVSALLRK